MADCLAVITSYPLAAIGGVMDTSSFFMLGAPEQAQLQATYLCVWQDMMYGSGLEVEPGFPEQKAHCIYSQQNDFAPKMRALWNFARENVSYGKRLGSLTFVDMRNEPGLQAADLLAYEVRHHYHLRRTRPDLPVRYPLARMIDHQREQNVRRIKFLPGWYFIFQASEAYQQAIEVLDLYDEDYAEMRDQRYLPNLNVLEGIETMRVLERYIPAPWAHAHGLRALVNRPRPNPNGPSRFARRLGLVGTTRT